MDLGLADDEAWGLTPRLLVSLMERTGEIREAESRRMARCAGEVAAAIYTVNRDTKKRKEAYTWTDIFPEYADPDKPQPEEDIGASLRAFARGWASQPHGQ